MYRQLPEECCLLHVFLIQAVLFGVFVTACSSDGHSEDSRTTLSRGLNGDPESLDPHLFASTQAGAVLRDLGEGLVSYSANGKLVPGNATNWVLSDDALLYTFELRRDARWSNGEPVVAEDFVYGFRRLVDPNTGSPSAKKIEAIDGASQILSGIADLDSLGVKAIDAYTLEIRLEYPVPYFLQLLAHPSTFPLYEPGIDQYGGQHVRADRFVTNGPYRLVARSPGSSLELQQNPHYWDVESIWFDTVLYHVLSPNIEIVRYLAGELDITDNVDSVVFDKMKEERPSELRVAPYFGVYYYGFNLTKVPFKDKPSLREALSLAIDREIIVRSITRRGEVPAYGWVPPGMHNYEPQSFGRRSLTQSQREVEARRLYAESGFGPDNPLSFELRYNTLGGHEQIALAIHAMWRDVLGADVVLVNEEFKVLISNIMSMDVTQVFRLSWTSDFDDPQGFLKLFETGNPNNLTGYSSAAVDQRIAASAVEVNSNVRRELLEEAERLALADHPVIPIYFFVSKHLVAPDIDGWTANALDYHFSKHLRRIEDQPVDSVIDHN